MGGCGDESLPGFPGGREYRTRQVRVSCAMIDQGARGLKVTLQGPPLFLGLSSAFRVRLTVYSDFAANVS